MGSISISSALDQSGASPLLLGIIVIDICLLLIVLLLLYLNRKKKEALRIEHEQRMATVAAHSERYIALQRLAQQTNFINLYHILFLKHDCSSKQEFDNYTFEQYLAESLDNESFLSKIDDRFNAAHHNQQEWQRYLEALSSLPPYSSNWNEELEMCANAELPQPTCFITIRFQVTYTSPAGRNHYERKENYSESAYRDTLSQLNREAQERRIRQSQMAAERAKMTAGLRYDILKRDGFRCVLCGATARDGVELHVDHIIPVSKGGKTVMSNLRTLCDRCNLGKRDKLEN